MAPLLSSNDQDIKVLVTKNYDKIFNLLSEDKMTKYLGIFIEWLGLNKKDKEHNEKENRPLKRLSLDVSCYNFLLIIY